MQYCGAKREATLGEPYLNANFQVQNLRQFVCELEQHSQVRKLNIVMHWQSERLGVAVPQGWYWLVAAVR